MLPPMFGMGGSEILVILIVALLFLGPDKLPDAAKKISKGIRDIKKQSRVLQQTIEDDERIGGAIRDIKSALRGEDPPPRPRPQKPKQIAQVSENTIAAPEPGAPEHAADGPPIDAPVDAPVDAPIAAPGPAEHANGTTNGTAEAEPKVTLPPTAGEMDPDHPDAVDPSELASLVKPAAGAVPRATPDDKPEPSHG